MSTTYEIPLIPGTDQTLQVSLSGTVYDLRLHWNSVCGPNGTWILDMYSSSNIPVLRGIPLVTGADLFAQYPEFNLGGSLVALTLGGSDSQSPFEVPTESNIGTDSHLYYTVP